MRLLTVEFDVDAGTILATIAGTEDDALALDELTECHVEICEGDSGEYAE